MDHGMQPMAMFKYACFTWEATVDIFRHAGLITRRHRYEDVVAPPP